MLRRIVVVGAGLAGLRAAEALRRSGFAGDLTIVGAEPHEPYDRPPLSKQMLAGAIEPAACALRRRPGIEARWRMGRRAVALDACARRVTLDDGDELRFDGLVVATGAAARAWPVASEAALDGVHVLRSLDDAVALRAAIARARRVVVLGAGFIGCEVAATLRTAGVAVTLVDVLAHPLAPLGAALGEVCAGLHLAHGVELRLGRRVAALEGDGRLTGVRLQDGERIAADVAVVALGAAPAVGWLEASGLAGRDGVPVDRHCFADEARRIVCAGDAAVFPHPLVDSGPVAIRHWSNAAEQAPVAAANLLAAPGERRAYAPVPSFWSDQYDVRIQSVGFPALADRVEIVDGSPQEGRLLAVAERGGRLIGAVAFNSARRLVEYRRALADSVAATAVGS